MFLIDKYSDMINNTNFDESIINNVYDKVNIILEKQKKIKKVKTIKDKIEILKNNNTNISHMVFYGIKGNSKEILVNKILGKIFGEKNIKLDMVEYEINGYGNVKTKVEIKQSKNHIVIEPNNNGFDKYLIQEVVKTYSTTAFLNITKKSKDFKFVVINKIDKLSEYAQASLRRTIEMVSDKCKFIFICDQLSRIIEPLRSRCILFRIPLMNETNIFKILLDISINEKIKISSKDIHNIIKDSGNMINNAIWNLELFKNNYSFNNNWKDLLNKLADDIFSITTLTDKQFNSKLFDFSKKARETFYLLFITNLEIKEIFRKLMKLLLMKCDNINIKLRIIEITSIFEKRISTGTRYIIHFEAYLMRILYLLYQYKHGKDFCYDLDSLEL